MTGVLRSRRMTLINARATAAATISAELGSGGTSDSAMARVRALDMQIVANDDALERLLELTRPGAELQADRRMKAAAIEIAAARLEEVRAYLSTKKLERIADRVSVVNPRFEIDDALMAGGRVTIETQSKKRAK